MKEPELTFRPLTPANWQDLVRLFGPHGADGGCWCMYWRLTRRQFSTNGNSGNKQAMRELVESGQVPGIIAYSAEQPVGWCSVAPRQDFGSLERSPVLKRIDSLPVWSIVCFFVAEQQRNLGVSHALLEAAVEFVRQQGGRVVEAYPSTLPAGQQDPGSLYMGLVSSYQRAGFSEVAQPSKRKLIMRRVLKG